ncbi:MAG: GNAT family N-acetyltransferase [Gaiellaceae bacterium]|jgi:GNAT superfamily N-acetyltransferase
MRSNAIVRRRMPDVEIRPFSDEHLDAAAALLAARHERHLAAEPLLARDVDYRAQLEGDGVVALRDGELRAYLLGQTTDDDAFVGFGGCAAAEPELMRDLYSALAPQWQRDRHRVYVPASDAALVDVWFRLAFGLQFTLAAREPVPGTGAGVRPGRREDLDAVVRLEHAFTEHLREPPSFSARSTQSDDELRADWEGTWDDERYAHLVVERDRRVVGHALLFRREPGDLRVPANTIDLALVVTLPEVRGTGAGTALVTHALGWAHERGLDAVTIDWRVVNLLADRFFRARGFRPTFVRLYRHVP